MTPTDRVAARATCPCYGDGVTGPRECSDTETCELHHHIAEALGRARAAGAAAMLALMPERYHDRIGYEEDRDYDGEIDGWYCRGKSCGQPFGKPHLDACEVAIALRALSPAAIIAAEQQEPTP